MTRRLFTAQAVNRSAAAFLYGLLPPTLRPPLAPPTRIHTVVLPPPHPSLSRDTLTCPSTPKARRRRTRRYAVRTWDSQGAAAPSAGEWGERLTDGLCPRPQCADEAAEVMHGVGLAASSKVGSEDGGGETERQGACALAGSMARAQQAAWRGSLG